MKASRESKNGRCSQMIETTQHFELLEENLVIKSITLLDGMTPDEGVQYKVGREVSQVKGKGEGHRIGVFYNESRVWYTFPIQSIRKTDECLVLQDNRSIYTFRKRSC